MKSIIVLCLFAVAAVAYARPGETYTAKFDNINLDEILTNTRLRHNYVECALDVGRCTPEGKEMKSHIKEGLQQKCAKCTKAQREGVERVFSFLINEDPESWSKLKAKYDPTGEYSVKYETDLRKLKH